MAKSVSSKAKTGAEAAEAVQHTSPSATSSSSWTGLSIVLPPTQILTPPPTTQSQTAPPPAVCEATAITPSPVLPFSERVVSRTSEVRTEDMVALPEIAEVPVGPPWPVMSQSSWDEI